MACVIIIIIWAKYKSCLHRFMNICMLIMCSVIELMKSNETSNFSNLHNGLAHKTFGPKIILSPNFFFRPGWNCGLNQPFLPCQLPYLDPVEKYLDQSSTVDSSYPAALEKFCNFACIIYVWSHFFQLLCGNYRLFCNYACIIYRLMQLKSQLSNLLFNTKKKRKKREYLSVQRALMLRGSWNKKGRFCRCR